MGKISRAERNRRIEELYKKGYSYRQIQKRYRVSSKTISKLVKGTESKCQMCGMPRGRRRFHAHHPDRRLFPNYTVLLCPSCHARVTAEERRVKQASPPPSSTLPLPQTVVRSPVPSTPSLQTMAKEWDEWYRKKEEERRAILQFFLDPRIPPGWKVLASLLMLTNTKELAE